MLRFTPAEVRVADPSRFAAQERAAERERNAKHAALRIASHGGGDAGNFTAVAQPSPMCPQLCIVLQTPGPSVARVAEIVRYCSAQQGSGACSVMAVQIDGQVLQFSVAAVAQLAPLQKSASAAVASC